VLGLLEMAGGDVDGLPPDCAHDRGGVQALVQQVLRGANAQPVAAEFPDDRWIEPRAGRGGLDQAFDRGGAETAVDRVVLVDRA